jgi:acetyl-CoA synthetase
MSHLLTASREFKELALISMQKYHELYRESIEHPNQFWAQQAERLHWFKKWDQVHSCSFQPPVKIEWFKGGKLNVSFNCIDRHLPEHAQRTAFIFEGDDINTPSRNITYQKLHDEVCKYALVLKKSGVKKGDRVTIYMPMIPETAFAMLACSRLGAIHSVVFGGFSPDSISDRIKDCDSEWVITADEGLRGGKKIPLKLNMDQALQKASGVKKVFVVRHTSGNIGMQSGRDVWMHEEVQALGLKEGSEIKCEVEWMDAEDPLFILYTSGSTGKPKGVVHTTGGYLLYASLTHQLVFDYKPRDIFWCTADVGWVTGHSYVVYGPLCNAATVLMYEGVPNYPDHSRFWKIIDKHKVSIFYTAPTAIRALMKEGESWVKSSSRKSLRLLGSVGEPINPEAWLWYYNNVGDARCPIVDTWWQTETGGIMITPLPGAFDMKPGSATLPFFGVYPRLLTPEGKEIHGAGEGVLALSGSWPGQSRTVYKDHRRFEETYFSTYKGFYFTGDGCRRDEDGYYWITGRVDDVLNVSGHRIGTAEIESALVAHPAVAEAAVVGYPHDIKGQGIYVYVTLKQGLTPSDELRKELIQWVGKEIGAIAKPDLLQWAPGLPKTRSGKIMRRILRKIAENSPDQLGDISTLADPAVVADLVGHRLHRPEPRQS